MSSESRIYFCGKTFVPMGAITEIEGRRFIEVGLVPEEPMPEIVSGDVVLDDLYLAATVFGTDGDALIVRDQMAKRKILRGDEIREVRRDGRVIWRKAT